MKKLLYFTQMLLKIFGYVFWPNNNIKFYKKYKNKMKFTNC